MFNTRQTTIVRIIISVAGTYRHAEYFVYIYPLDMELHGLSMFLLTASLMFAPLYFIGPAPLQSITILNLKLRTNEIMVFWFHNFNISDRSFLFALAFIFGEDWFLVNTLCHTMVNMTNTSNISFL